jgi:hypothetical protein
MHTNVDGHACRGCISHAEHERREEEVDVEQTIVSRHVHLAEPLRMRATPTPTKRSTKASLSWEHQWEDKSIPVRTYPCEERDQLELPLLEHRGGLVRHGLREKGPQPLAVEDRGGIRAQHAHLTEPLALRRDVR